MMKSLYQFVPLFAIAALLSVGCGDGKPRAYPVDGKLVFSDGSPVPGSVVITFRTTIDGVEYIATGDVKQDGRFTLTTHLPNDGAVAGEHRISVGWMPQGELDRRIPFVADRYGSEDTSGLTVVIEPGKNTPVLTIEPPKR